jgi:tRNA(Arg) A34 adenosine deaminase TadA
VTEDERFMTIALAEARAATAEGNRPFGAVIVRGGQVVEHGHNLVESENDPTAHGEVVAIRAACRALQSPSLEGATLYTTCEPCLMCTSAIMWAGIPRVVIGATWADVPAHFHPEKGSLLGMAQHVSDPFEYTAGVLRDECVELYGG